MRALQAFLFVCGVLFFMSPAHAVPFEDLKGRAALLVITGPQSDPSYVGQMDLLRADTKGLLGRGVITVYFKDKNLFTINDLSSFSYVPQNLKRSKASVAAYYEQYLQTDDDLFSLVLMGRDGRVYHVWTTVTPVSDIYYMIDNPPPEEHDIKAVPVRKD